jgi:hypothetical protein
VKKSAKAPTPSEAVKYCLGEPRNALFGRLGEPGPKTRKVKPLEMCSSIDSTLGSVLSRSGGL